MPSERGPTLSGVTKRKRSLQDLFWGIGCLILVLAAILLFVYYQTGRDIVFVGIALVVALVIGLFSLITGKHINN